MGKVMHEDDLAKHIAEGVTAKLNFDFACHRGHGFGETYIHGVINEILCARTMPNEQKIECGYPLPEISNSKGRKKEIDFAVISPDEEKDHDKQDARCLKCAIEVKWAGSSHCDEKHILSDLARLQWLFDKSPNVECFFVLSGHQNDVRNCFEKEDLLAKSTNKLLSINRKRLLKSNWMNNFSLRDNNFHKKRLEELISDLKSHNAWVLDSDRISTKLISPRRLISKDERFLTYVWELTPLTH